MERPESVQSLERRWRLTVGVPLDNDSGSAWVAPVTRWDGTRAVLKLAAPHMEAEHESEGLRFWNGDPTVRLLDADDQLGAMLLERCEPGTPLRTAPESEQDRIIAILLRRLWRQPAPRHPFRPLLAMTMFWRDETLAQSEAWPDAGLVREGLRFLADLAQPSAEDVLLATDLHAGNVLRAEREPWLVIDPKPFVGDRAYDATQHLLNGPHRLRCDPHGTIARLADLLDVDANRVRLWMFARTAAEPRQRWDGDWRLDIARGIAP